MHNVSRQESGTLKMSPESQKQKKQEENGDCDVLWEGRDLETVEGRMVLSEKKSRGTDSEGCCFSSLHTSAA